MLGAVIGRRQGGGRGHSGEYDRKPPMGGQGGHGGNGQQGGYGSHEGHGGPTRIWTTRRPWITKVAHQDFGQQGGFGGSAGYPGGGDLDLRGKEVMVAAVFKVEDLEMAILEREVRKVNSMNRILRKFQIFVKI
ncbi:hypothetical protein COOONC_21215 [Cooperia oncophora]